MVYVARDGTIYNEKPWGVDKVLDVFYWLFCIVASFFQTLFLMDGSKPKNNLGNSRGWRSGGGGGGGGGGPSFRPGGGRPGGNVRGMGDLPPPGPPPSCGSCCGR